MSAVEVVPEAVAIKRKVPVWHAPADFEQRERATTGQPWVARCGKRVKRTAPGTVARKAWQLAPIERCVVCVGLRP